MELTQREKNAYERKNIMNSYHLRRWFPIRYIDNTKETGLIDGAHSCILGVVESIEERPMKNQRGSFFLMKVQERLTGAIVSIMFFHQPYAYQKYKGLLKQWVFISGKAKYEPPFGWSLNNVDTLEAYSDKCFKIIPIYSKIAGISDKSFEKHLQLALSEPEEETMTNWMMDRYHVVDINTALKKVMTPVTSEDIEVGNKRFLVEDLFYLASQFVLSERNKRSEGTSHIEKTDVMESIRDSFPYALTKGQSETVNAIIDKMKSGEPLHALVQGDVGCGKTITGFLPMIAVAENGGQTCLVAPTKILAKQHYEKLIDLLKGTDIEVGFFAGTSVKKKDLERLKSGKMMIAVGTHSLISDCIEFKNLELVVIDEEHKFGVDQRQKLIDKAEHVDVISMSATPIPRTLALAIYGNDIEIFSIKDMPGCRKPIKTLYDDGTNRLPCVNYILNQGQQVYVVCPAIDIESTDENTEEIMSVNKAKELYSKLFPNASIATLDGTMRASETDEVLKKFKSGETQILIATTVVEVGVDVPNATFIIIENAERFGLAQLHQLRGRVGRGNLQSYCFLVSNNPDNERIKTLCTVSDGFTIARIDMEQLRKAGNIFGTVQSGFNKYVEEMVANPTLYNYILNDVRTVTDEILKKQVEKVLKTEFPKRRVA